MDMYQKRKMRQEKKKIDKKEESLSKVGINWYKPILVNFHTILYL